MTYLSTVTALVAPGRFAISDSFTAATARLAWYKGRSIARSRASFVGYTIHDVSRVVERESAQKIGTHSVEHIATGYIRRGK